MSRNTDKGNTSAIDETNEETSTVKKMDSLVLPLIKGVTIMSLKATYLSAFVLVTTAALPVVGLAEQPPISPPVKVEEQLVIQENPVLIEREIAAENKEPFWTVQNLKEKATAAGMYVKDNVTTIVTNITDDDKQIENLKRQVAELVERNNQLVTLNTELVVRHNIDHKTTMSCAKRVVLYLESLEMPE